MGQRWQTRCGNECGMGCLWQKLFLVGCKGWCAVMCISNMCDLMGADVRDNKHDADIGAR